MMKTRKSVVIHLLVVVVLSSSFIVSRLEAAAATWVSRYETFEPVPTPVNRTCRIDKKSGETGECTDLLQCMHAHITDGFARRKIPTFPLCSYTDRDGKVRNGHCCAQRPVQYQLLLQTVPGAAAGSGLSYAPLANRPVTFAHAGPGGAYAYTAPGMAVMHHPFLLPAAAHAGPALHQFGGTPGLTWPFPPGALPLPVGPPKPDEEEEGDSGEEGDDHQEEAAEVEGKHPTVEPDEDAPSGGNGNVPDGPPWIPGVNWPPPIPTHAPDALTHPPLPTHPPSMEHPAVVPTTTKKPKRKRPTTTTTANPWWQPPPTTKRPRPTKPGPTSADCGSTNLNFRIVGGSPASRHEYRWMAAMFIGNRLTCGGSLIDNYHVLTAAHCVKGVTPSSIKIQLGDHDVTTTTEADHTTVRVSSIRIHPSYSEHQNTHDIAILRLSSRVVYDQHILPICLPSQGETEPAAGSQATVAGWGSLQWRVPTSSVLYEVNLTVWDNHKCDAAFSRFFNRPSGTITSHMLCAGELAKDSCTGDSGGPMMVLRNNHWVQVGVVSWGIQCGSTHLPGVYSRVSSFRTWIDQNRT